MELYVLKAVLYNGPPLTTYEAWSKRYEKDVIVKCYQLQGIASSECLLKEAVRQAREKPRESAVLMDVAFSSVEGSDEAFRFNFVLERKKQQVDREIITRDDGYGHWVLGLTGYEIRSTLYAHEDKKVDVAYCAHLKKEVVIKSKECFFAHQANSLLREAFALAYVEHPYICKLIDICISRQSIESGQNLHFCGNLIKLDEIISSVFL